MPLPIRMICAGLAAVCGGCAGFPHREPDPAPPFAALVATGPAGPVRLEVGQEGALVDLSESDSLVLSGTAEDGEGVGAFSLQGHAWVTCRDPATGALERKSTGFLRLHEPGGSYRPSGLFEGFPALGARRTAPERRDARFVLRPRDLAGVCRCGRLESATGRAVVQAENILGGSSSTPPLEFRLSPPPVAAQAIVPPGYAGLADRAEPGPGGAAGPAGKGRRSKRGIAARISGAALRCPLPSREASRADGADASDGTGNSVPVGGSECREPGVTPVSPRPPAPDSARPVGARIHKRSAKAQTSQSRSGYGPARLPSALPAARFPS